MSATSTASYGPSLSVRPATPVDLGTIREILAEAELPDDGVAEHLHNMLVGELGTTIVATAGVEVCGSIGLVRSVAVRSSHRGDGLGVNIVQALLRRAEALGLTDLYLLTTTAAPYFERFGFRAVARADAPAPIMRTLEFSALCPESAALMRRAV